MNTDPEFDQIAADPNTKAPASGFPLETAGDIVVGTVTEITSEQGKFEDKTGAKPDIPIVTLTRVKVNGTARDGDLTLKGYRAGLRRLLSTASVSDRLGVKYVGQSAGGMHMYEGGSRPAQGNTDLPVSDPGPAAPKADGDDSIPFQKSL